MTVTRRQRAIGILTVGFALTAVSASAQTPSPFYRNKGITLVVGSPPGGGYDAYGRLLSQHYGKFLGGNTTVTVQNMPGAGSLKAANYLYRQAPKNGLTIGAIEPILILNQAFNFPGVEFDLRKFTWVGRLATSTEMTVAWNPTPANSIEQAKTRELAIGAASAGGSSAGFPRVMNAVVGTKFKIIPGYGGMAGIALAMERGEVQGGHTTVARLLTDGQDWVTQHKISILVQYSQDRNPNLANVPTMVEFARNDEERKILSLFGSMADIGRVLLAPPDLPKDRVMALRAAFHAMTSDASVKADVARLRLEFEPESGEELQKRIEKTFDISPAVAEKAATVWKGKD